MRKILLIAFLALVASCGSVKNIAYIQDVPLNVEQAIAESKNITLQANDMISIVVSSKDSELSTLFNLPRVQRAIGDNYSTSTGEISLYIIDSEGYIDFPLLGKIEVAGKKREEVAAFIKESLISEQLIKDIVVTVNFMNLSFSVLGEVSKPGQYKIDKDKITLLDAISQAGDLTIYGLREEILLTREVDGKRITYSIDLTSADTFNSPAFYIQQNDVIYVKPNTMRANQSTVNANNVKSTSFWLSLSSLLTTVLILILN